MDVGHFYYLNDQYFIDFPDPQLMQNKETINGQLHDRPCFYAFQDDNTGLFLNLQVYTIKKYRNMANAIQLYLVMFLVIEKLF